MKAVPLFISYETGVLQRSLSDQTRPRVAAILGTTLSLSITFLDDAGAAMELEADSTGRLVCRSPDALDGDTVLLDAAWSHADDTTLYTLQTLADSEQLRNLIKSEPCFTLAAQIEFTIPGEDDPRKSLTFDLIIHNGPARGDEGAPDVADYASWLWLKEKLEAGSNITLTENDTTKVITIAATGAGGGGADWGDIGGTLADQTDLQSALNAKLSITAAEAAYQPLAALLTALSALSNASGVLTNNGSGALSYTATSTGGNGGTDDGKLVKFSEGNGSIIATAVVRVKPYGGGSGYIQIEPTRVVFIRGAGDYCNIYPPTEAGAYSFYLPSVAGAGSHTLALEDGNITGTSGGLSSTLEVTSGGTGQTSYTDGQLLIGNTTGNTLDKATLTAGSGISITNGHGTITIASTSSGGTVTSVAASVPSFLSVIFAAVDVNAADQTLTDGLCKILLVSSWGNKVCCVNLGPAAFQHSGYQVAAVGMSN